MDELSFLELLSIDLTKTIIKQLQFKICFKTKFRRNYTKHIVTKKIAEHEVDLLSI